MFFTINNIDLNILLWVQNNLRYDLLTAFFTHITSIGSILLALIAAWLILKGSRYEKFVGITSLVSAIIEVAIVNGFLKNLIARPRPLVEYGEVVPIVNILSEYSFPSGHTALAFAMAFVFYRLMPKSYGVIAIMIAAFVGISRVYLGVHYLSDVIGGIVVAYVASRIAEVVVEKFWMKRDGSV